MELHRATDHIDQTLQDLIGAENDPSKRANLMVLQSMALNLSANTMALNALSGEINDHKAEFIKHREDFRVHAEEEQAILSQMRGGSKVFMYFIGLIQAVVFAGFALGMNSYSTLVNDFHDLQISVSAYHAKIDNLVDLHKGK